MDTLKSEFGPLCCDSIDGERRRRELGDEQPRAAASLRILSTSPGQSAISISRKPSSLRRCGPSLFAVICSALGAVFASSFAALVQASGCRRPKRHSTARRDLSGRNGRKHATTACSEVSSRRRYLTISDSRALLVPLLIKAPRSQSDTESQISSTFDTTARLFALRRSLSWATRAGDHTCTSIAPTSKLALARPRFLFPFSVPLTVRLEMLLPLATASLFASSVLAAPLAEKSGLQRRWDYSKYFNLEGHRGARGQYVETTLPAFADALKSGVV